MHIAYSALRPGSTKNRTKPANKQLLERYNAYQAVCQKYGDEIAAIQKYLPGWTPPFKAGNY